MISDFQGILDLKKNHDDMTLDSLSFELSQKLYHYGDHFKRPLENNPFGLKQMFKNFFIDAKVILSRLSRLEDRPIMSGANFGLNKELKEQGLFLFHPPWAFNRKEKYICSLRLRKTIKTIQHHFQSSEFSFFFTESFSELLLKFRSEMRHFLLSNNLRAVIFSNDLAFFENQTIQICKELEIPSFIFLHGLPARYNNIDDNRADYLLVWSDEIQHLYINAGVDKEKIIVCGNPRFDWSGVTHHLRNDLNDVLVLTHSMPGASTIDIKGPYDRCRLISYLYSIQQTLESLGVKHARYRCHPSENEEWYKKFLDASFYSPSEPDLNLSLKRSSMVIGPTSTVFLEAINQGVNYVVFEPLVNGLTLTNMKLIPPFDGSETGISVAYSCSELKKVLEERKLADINLAKKYAGSSFSTAEITNRFL